MLRGATPRATRARGGGAHAQPGLQAVVLLRHPEAAPVLQRDEGLVGEARAELPEEAALEVGQHAVHVHQHPQGAAGRPARRPAQPSGPRRHRCAAGPPRAPAAQPDHGPWRALAANTGAMSAGGDTADRGADVGGAGCGERARGRGRAGCVGRAGLGARGARGARARRLKPQSEAAASPPLKGPALAEAGPRGVA